MSFQALLFQVLGTAGNVISYLLGPLCVPDKNIPINSTFLNDAFGNSSSKNEIRFEIYLFLVYQADMTFAFSTLKSRSSIVPLGADRIFTRLVPFHTGIFSIKTSDTAVCQWTSRTIAIQRGTDPTFQKQRCLVLHHCLRSSRSVMTRY